MKKAKKKPVKRLPKVKITLDDVSKKIDVLFKRLSEISSVLNEIKATPPASGETEATLPAHDNAGEDASE
jgi:hypothetical protein